MADETKKPEPRRVTPRAADAGAPEASSDALAVPQATEKPVPQKAVPATSRYIVTVDNKTGQMTKVERLDDAGARHELSKHEEASLMYGTPVSTMSGASAALTPLTQAYWQGYADYLAAIMGTTPPVTSPAQPPGQTPPPSDQRTA